MAPNELEKKDLKSGLYYYRRAVNILDNLLDESQKLHKEPRPGNDWKRSAIAVAFTQANNIVFCLMSNTQHSRFVNDRFVVEPTLIGCLGRMIRDLYVLTSYLNTNVYPDEHMKLCWDFQVINRQLVAVEYQEKSMFQNELLLAEQRKSELRQKIEKLSFYNKKKVLQGRDEKMMSLHELAKVKGFNPNRFENEFVFFSQFAHATAFANNLIYKNGIDFNIIAHTYDRIVAYYFGVIFETISTLYPDQVQLTDLKVEYEKIIAVRWT